MLCPLDSAGLLLSQSINVESIQRVAWPVIPVHQRFRVWPGSQDSQENGRVDLVRNHPIATMLPLLLGHQLQKSAGKQAHFFGARLIRQANREDDTGVQNVIYTII